MTTFLIEMVIKGTATVGIKAVNRQDALLKAKKAFFVDLCNDGTLEIPVQNIDFGVNDVRASAYLKE